MAKPKVKFKIKDTTNGQFTWSVALGNNEKLSASESIKAKANAWDSIVNLVNAIRTIDSSIPTESLIIDETKSFKKKEERERERNKKAKK